MVLTRSMVPNSCTPVQRHDAQVLSAAIVAYGLRA